MSFKLFNRDDKNVDYVRLRTDKIVKFSIYQVLVYLLCKKDKVFAEKFLDECKTEFSYVEYKRLKRLLRVVEND